ncbi:MAG: prfA [Ilumatobacteraceae bacterium]|nr:prfA [Ilumatobacteraceae bacterium]
MFDRLTSLEDEFVSLESSLADPEIGNDQVALRSVSKRYKELAPVVDCIRRRQVLVADAATARELLAAAEGHEREMWRDELTSIEARLADAEEELRVLMLPKDPNDGKAVIIEIRGAEGGEEANLFARDLYDMYRAYAANKGWSVEVLSHDPSDLGGINQITMLLGGATTWGRMKFEGGTHRVQRVPVTESQGRIHTSSATVLMLAEAEEVEVDIDERDLEIDVYRASGPGGQGVNTTDSAVRITHRPTGVVVAMQDERSQLQNRARAMIVLRARLLKLAQEEHDAAMSVERRSQVGTGGRGEKIRTYNFKENRVTDHRIPFTTYRLQEVLAGDLDIVVDALAADERARQLAGDG